MNFTYYIPTRILFGAGKLNELATCALPGKKALIVISSGKSMRANGYLDRVIDLLKKNGVGSVVYDKILPNPVKDHVMEGAAVAKANGCDFVVGLGGGSSIDSAKSIAVMAKNPGDYWDYVSGGSGKGQPLVNGALPIVAITTTAGTGTEADPWTVITKTETQEKIGYGCDATFPTLSIVDPELMLSVPPELTAFQGMDAFFHAAEGYIANVAQPASDLFALESIRLITKYLPIAVKDGSNLEARSAVAWANTLSGMVESTSCCISEHSIEHALSGIHPEIPHGAGLIMLSRAYHDFMSDKAPDRYPAMAAAMGVDISNLPPEKQPKAFVDALATLIVDIGMADISLIDYNVSPEEAEAIAANAWDTMGGLFELDPYRLDITDTTSIIRDAFVK
ncbi:MAG: iron-containing alcohol dehydrogenase [Lentisphaerae bacterium]|nr:iron-containing alcohol dehydrogenase [Lentisphaerota bacterium]